MVFIGLFCIMPEHMINKTYNTIQSCKITLIEFPDLCKFEYFNTKILILSIFFTRMNNEKNITILPISYMKKIYA